MITATGTAKLFGLCAAGFGALSLILASPGHKPAVDLYIHDGYFVIANFHIALAAAAICTFFAIL